MRKLLWIIIPVIVLTGFIYIRLQPLRAFKYYPPYSGKLDFTRDSHYPDTLKKTVVIMADNGMTELFDLLAPFYLFSETGMANVYIAAPRFYPILTENGPFILPHYTYREIDSLGLIPDLVVIPYMHAPEDSLKTNWLKSLYSDSVLILSICDGAWTAAASGIYDGKKLTSHATGHEKLKAKFPKPTWVQNTRFVQDGNLFSTGGVSNATDGSLAVIEKLFGKETRQKVMEAVNYPYADLQKDHASNPLDFPAKMEVLKKMLFKSNKHLGILLNNGINEIELAAVFDIYARTMPASIKGIVPTGNSITTKHGLTVLSIDKIKPDTIEELHLLGTSQESFEYSAKFGKAKMVTYNNDKVKYIVDICLEAIRDQYGQSFSDFVKLTLDYN